MSQKYFQMKLQNETTKESRDTICCLKYRENIVKYSAIRKELIKQKSENKNNS